MACPKHVILFVDVTSLNDAVMSQHHMCIVHMTIYYKRATNTLVGFLPLVCQFVRFDSVTRDPCVAGV